jgi:hypothetical protein
VSSAVAAEGDAKMACKCGNQACAVRLSRGLKTFCEIEPSVKATPNWYPTYSAAVAANPGRRIRCVGSILAGSPKRFIAE